MNDSFKDVFFRQDALHVLDELVRLVHLIVLEVVDDEVEAGLRDYVVVDLLQCLISSLLDNEHQLFVVAELKILQATVELPH